MDIPYSSLFNIFTASPKDVNNFVSAVMTEYDISDESFLDCEGKLRTFFKNAKVKWIAVARTRDRFVKKNEEWLSLSLHLNNRQMEEMIDLPSTSSSSRGRPTKPFEECATYAFE